MIPEIKPATPLDLEQFKGHTPGPWHQPERYSPEEGANVPSGSIENSSGDSIAVGCWPDVSTLAAAANSRLIAAAPALLAECRRQREQIEELRTALSAVYALRSDVQNIADKLGQRFATGPAVNRYERAFTQARAALQGNSK